MATQNNPSDELIGITIAGRYRIISRLGAGGMGTAYRAWDEQAGIPVVVKIPKKLLLENPKFVERFSREIRLLQGLDHPRIVPIIDVGEHESLPFVAMRFLPGGSLSQRRLRDSKGRPCPNPSGMLRLWLPAVAEALDYVHAHGVVHRDVKPANIFFDAFWGAYLGDFGIAKVIEESEVFDKESTLTATHMGIGTQEYMAPEQFTPKALVDGRADQYALSVIVYEILTGTRPFKGEKTHIVIEATTHAPPPLQDRRPDLPASLVASVHKGLAKKPDDRYPTCRDLAAAILVDVPHMADEPGVARLLCPKCASMLKLPAKAAGRTGRCPQCRTAMKVADDLGSLWLLDESKLDLNPAVPNAPAGGGMALEPESRGSGPFAELFKPASATSSLKHPVRRRRKATSAVIVAALAASVAAICGLCWVLRPETYEDRLRKSQSALKANPLDEAANLFVGKDLCFRQSAWDIGLSYLARSGDKRLATAAQKELAALQRAPGNAGDLIRAAAEWWRIAASPTAQKKDAAAMKKHAADLYRKHAGSTVQEKDAAFARAWLTEDETFRKLVGDARPPTAEPSAPEKEFTQKVGVEPVTTGTQTGISKTVMMNSVGMKLILVQPGSFTMGAADDDPAEQPPHTVRITRPFYLGMHEVTNSQWRAVMAQVPSNWTEDDRPVERVSWNDAVDFCRRLSALPAERAAGRAYRLPTEAEWECACRAGTTTNFACADDALAEHAWFGDNSGRSPADVTRLLDNNTVTYRKVIRDNGCQTHPVGEKKPNAWGFHDMHGNVWEWCQDWAGPYVDSSPFDPGGPPHGDTRVIRGGSWDFPPRLCRSAVRRGQEPSFRNANTGLRVAVGMARGTFRASPPSEREP